MGQIGGKPLRELTAGDVRGGLESLSDRLSTRYLQIAKASLARAIRYAEGGRGRAGGLPVAGHWRGGFHYWGVAVR